MNEFTLFKALNILKRHLLVSIALFSVTYWALPSLNIFENQYEAEKIIKTGEHHPGFILELLDYQGINGILISSSFKNYLKKNIGESGVSSFKISENDVGNMILTFKGNNPDSIINTANAVMDKLQEFDQKIIQKQSDKINKILDIDRQLLEILIKSIDEYEFTDEDILIYSNLQKKYDTAIDEAQQVNEKYNTQVFNLMRFKKDDVNRKIRINKEIINQQQKIDNLETIIKEDFKTLSYLFPVSKNELIVYFPNPIVYFGISLLVVFFYNLILLSYKYRKSVK